MNAPAFTAALPVRTRVSHALAATSPATDPIKPILNPTMPSAPTVDRTIRAAKHAQFKAAKKADRKRPKKHRPSDINRAPPTFDPEPLRAEGLPPVFELVSPDDADSAFEGLSVLADAAAVEADDAESTAVEADDAESAASDPDVAVAAGSADE